MKIRFIWLFLVSLSVYFSFGFLGCDTPNEPTPPPAPPGSKTLLFAIDESGPSLYRFEIQSDGKLNLIKKESLPYNPTAIAASASGKTLYLTHIGAGGPGLTSIEINQTTGGITIIDELSTGDQPRSVAVHPSGNFVVTADLMGGSVSTFTAGIDSSIHYPGSATGPVSVNVGQYPTKVEFSPDGNYLYVANNASNNLEVFSFNTTTAGIVPIDTVYPGSGPFSVAAHPNGKYVYALNRSDATVVTYKRESGGSLTKVSSIATGTDPVSITILPTGNFAFIANQGSSDITVCPINATTGELTVPAKIPAGGYSPQGIWFDPTGVYGYVANYASNTIELFQRATGTGLIVDLSTNVKVMTPRAIAIVQTHP